MWLWEDARTIFTYATILCCWLYVEHLPFSLLQSSPSPIVLQYWAQKSAAIYPFPLRLALLVYSIYLTPAGIWSWDLQSIHCSYFWQTLWGRYYDSEKSGLCSQRPDSILPGMCLFVNWRHCYPHTTLPLRIRWQNELSPKSVGSNPSLKRARESIF